ncbi:hypothetical protein N0V94_002550 [Neodidymelliopsis sp. IMI 364377]|nr:hypothetical protein N0V94_002550 [Neodidymelliopsis sp. IMI 364377]
MARFNPLLQLYVRHNALLYTPHLPEETVYVSSSSSTEEQEELSYYLPPFDYADDLKRISVEATYTRMEEHEAEITALLKEAEFILYISAHRQYEYCHLGNVDDEERRQRLEELQLLQITYNKIRSAAEQLQSQLINWRISLQHKAILEASTSESSSLQAWLPKSTHDFTTHDPALSILELERTQAALDAEIKSFEASIAYPRYPKEKKDRWRMDLEDGRSLLRAADKIVLEFEKMQEAARNKSLRDADEASHTTVQHIVAKVDGKSQVDGTTAPKPPSGSLEPGQS